MFSVGSVLNFSYPAVNRMGKLTRLASRRVVIRSIRDLDDRPLDPRTVRLRPDLRRGRLLIQAVDLERQEWRQFYFDSMRSVRVCQVPLVRIGVYDPTGSHGPRLMGPILTDSRADQARAMECIARMNQWLRHAGRGEVARLFAVGGGV
ncbi:MAG: hypothetical protein SFX18_13365 [Pirellulales bacterium]|nr:hypothetical protein [Pirellulales bacterium]